MEKTLKNVMKKGLDMLEKRAERKANAECLGWIYEPKVPKKLKKTVCMGLACVTAIATILVGNPQNYKADSFSYREWDIMMTSPGSGAQYRDKSMYATTEKYEWAVTSCYSASGYGLVSLEGLNCTIEMLDGEGIAALTTKGEKEFVQYNKVSTDTYVRFRVYLSFDSYVTHYSGYIDILEGQYLESK